MHIMTYTQGTGFAKAEASDIPAFDWATEDPDEWITEAGFHDVPTVIGPEDEAMTHLAVFRRAREASHTWAALVVLTIGEADPELILCRKGSDCLALLATLSPVVIASATAQLTDLWELMSR